MRSSSTANGSALRVARSTPNSTTVEMMAITSSRITATGHDPAGGMIDESRNAPRMEAVNGTT